MHRYQITEHPAIGWTVWDTLFNTVIASRFVTQQAAQDCADTLNKYTHA